MHRLIAIVVVGCCFVTLATAQKPEITGAKALFYDATSGVQIMTPPSRSSATAPKGGGTPEQTSNRQPQKTDATRTDVSTRNSNVNTGLMYYVELVRPSGEVVRVTTDRVFHSGERIRLHFTSNVDGQISVMQKRTDGTAQRLFPDPRISSGDNFIKAKIDTILPAESAFFKFDNAPGEERLLVLLTAADREAKGTAVAANLSDDSARIATLLAEQKGSKDLLVEVDNSPSTAGTYVVAMANPSSKLPQETLALEIVLKHQP